MYIIIAGAGVVGFHIASLLAEEKHEVAVVEQSEEAVEKVRSQLDVTSILGNAATPKILKEAEAPRADLIIAVTDSDETNMITCFIAKELGASMTVARVRNPEYSGYFIGAAKSPSAPRKVVRPKTFGVDLFINPEVEAAREIISILSSFYPTPVENFADGVVQIREFRVERGTMVDKPLSDITFPKPCVIAAILRAGELIMPSVDELIKQGDHVYLVASREFMDELGEMFAQPQRPAKSVVILGGGRVGVLVAEGLQGHGVSVKIIEKNISRCQEVAAKLEQTTVVQGDGTDRDFLIEQGVPLADAFVATTESDELNILSGLLAKNLGVSRNLILITRPANIPLAEAVGVDVAASLPFDREDIALLAQTLDDVTDFIHAAADAMLIYKVECSTPRAKELADIIVQAAAEVERAMPQLRHPGELKHILQRCVEINRLENMADRVFRSAM
ncbi:unnamed protein product, partial [marine sediment metagenome]